MILHIPHASTNTLDKEFLCDINLELERMTDIDTDKLFDHPHAKRVVFLISRLVCDVERFEDDSIEEMAKKGMGVCYTTNSFTKPLRSFSILEREEIINEYYRPHHKALTGAVNKELNETGKSLLIDCHSFSNIPLPHEDSQSTFRPDICIGADSFHTPDWLLEITKKYFESYGYNVSINDPFTGKIIPMEHYHKDRRVNGILLEVNRDLYKNNFDTVQKIISIWLNKFIKE